MLDSAGLNEEILVKPYCTGKESEVCALWFSFVNPCLAQWSGRIFLFY